MAEKILNDLKIRVWRQKNAKAKDSQGNETPLQGDSVRQSDAPQRESRALSQPQRWQTNSSTAKRWNYLRC